MADMYNNIEQGADWPDGMSKARAAFMQKDENSNDDPTKFRVLLILSAPYRRWAGIRLRTLMEWIATWTTMDIYAGGDPMGATMATYGVGVNIESMELEGKPYCGATLDLARFC